MIVLYNQFNSVAQSRRTLCHPMNRSTPGLPVYFYARSLGHAATLIRIGGEIQEKWDWWEAAVRAFSTLEPFWKVRPEEGNPKIELPEEEEQARSALCVHSPG